MSFKNKLELSGVIKKLEEKKSTLPHQLANIAQSAFLNNFRTSSFFGKKWKEVQRRIPGTNAYKYPKKDTSKNKRGILLGQTRHLFHSVAHSIRQADWHEIRLGTDIPYAEYHNEGTDKIPQRRFMGDHPKLRAKLRRQINSEINSIFP